MLPELKFGAENMKETWQLTILKQFLLKSRNYHLFYCKSGLPHEACRLLVPKKKKKKSPVTDKHLHNCLSDKNSGGFK